MKTWIYLTISTLVAIAICCCMSYIGVRCITEGNSVQMGLGWVLVGLGLATILGGVWNITETLSDK